MSFAKSLSIADELTAEISQEVRKTGFLVLQGVTLKTPKDTGLATSSWLVGVNNAPLDAPTLSPVDAGSSNAYAINNGQQVIATYPQDKLPALWIVNNLPYIGRLNDGSSLQAPAKFVEQTIAEVTSGR